MLDFSKVFLTCDDIRFLQQSSNGSIFITHPASVQELLRLGFIDNYPLSNNKSEFVITPLGLRYVEYFIATSKVIINKGKQEKIIEIRNWITLGIAVTAFIKSFFF